MNANVKFKAIYQEIEARLRGKLSIEEDTEILDVTSGFFIKELINRGFYNLSDLGITFMMFIDEVEIYKRSKSGKNVCMIYLAINELSPEYRFQKKYLIPFGAF